MDSNAGGTGQTPDLQAILATLAKYTPGASTPYRGSTASSAIASGLSIPTVPTSIHEQVSPETEISQPLRHPQSISQPQERAGQALRSKPIDPSTITTWQEGLRCVTKIAAQNANFAATIKKMIIDQKAHEMRWFTERQNLKLAQAKRNEFATQADSIVATLNPSFVAPPKVSQSDADKADELAKFDLKIHTAQKTMQNLMSGELKALGVPFFGTDRSLITENNGCMGSRTVEGQRPRWSPMITEAQLLHLRRRMVEHLEDLYRD